jgi:hypothetical protein
MKIRNDDLGKLNELKLDLLAPPYSFRLNTIAASYIKTAIEIISKYSGEDEPYIQQLKDLGVAIAASADMSTLKTLCRQAALIISTFTNA